MSEHRVHVVGSINQDLMVSTPVYPKLGETVHGHHVAASPGGKGSNQAVAAATLGASTHMVGRVGSDAFGTAMLEALQGAGVDTRSIETSQAAQTGLAIVTHTDEGKNAIIVMQGANQALTPDALPHALATIEPGDVLVTQLEVPVPVVQRALELGREHGATTILNAAPAADVRHLLPCVDVLVVNEFEAGVVAAMATSTEQAARKAAATLAETHGIIVVLTLGEAGAMVARAGKRTDIPPFQVDAVDSTGAGDTFVGALAAFLALGHPLETACRWASAAGAHACLHVGAQAGVPTQQDLADRFGVGPARKESR